MKANVPKSFTPLDIPLPEILPKALGYDGDARFIAIYWTPAGDEAVVTDGKVSFDGNWQAFLTCIDHPAVALPLAQAGVERWALGSSDNEATHWLVLDLEERKACAAPADDAHNFLASQWPPAPSIQAED